MSSAKAPRLREISKRELQAGLNDIIQSALRRSQMLFKHKRCIEESNIRDSEIPGNLIYDPTIEKIKTENAKKSLKLAADSLKGLNVVLMRVEGKVSNSAKRLADSTATLYSVKLELAISSSKNRAVK